MTGSTNIDFCPTPVNAFLHVRLVLVFVCALHPYVDRAFTPLLQHLLPQQLRKLSTFLASTELPHFPACSLIHTLLTPIACNQCRAGTLIAASDQSPRSKMPFFSSIFKNKDSASKKNANQNGVTEVAPQKPRWEDAWLRKDVEPEEVQELIRGCTHEMKARGMASNPCAVSVQLRRHWSELMGTDSEVPQRSICPFSCYHSDQPQTLVQLGRLSVISSTSQRRMADR